MRVAVVHYHLRKGGVTRVIASALEALDGRIGGAVVLSSTQPEERLAQPSAVVPEPAYTGEASAGAARRRRDALRAAAIRALGGPPDLWHIHNHCLGKNVNFPEALKGLLEDGTPALLQIHDFAEDGRPGNYRAQAVPFEEGVFRGRAATLYPDAPQIGYAVLNGRDGAILRRAGLQSGRLFNLPNPVTANPLQATAARGAGRPLVLYPTRAIRRKNLGELLLMAAVFPQYRFGTTLAPKNPEWASVHDGWVQVARETGLDVGFALGERPGASFEGLLGEAAAVVTTSVGEGFGLAFLEPWLFGRPLCGRDLP